MLVLIVAILFGVYGHNKQRASYKFIVTDGYDFLGKCDHCFHQQANLLKYQQI